MRYFIAGMDVARGTEADDVSGARPYYELGWEVVTTHFDVKRMKKEGRLDPERDTIVTCSGREFLYTAELSRVIDHDAYLRRESTSADSTIWLTDRYTPGQIPIDYFEGDRHTTTSRYKHHHADCDIITHVEVVDVAPLHLGAPYACLVVRRRGHGAYRNMDDATARRILDELRGKYERVFLVGRGAERHEDRPGVTHVDLKTYASLIQDELCELIVGSFTGPMQLAALLSRARLCLVLNHDGYDVAALNDPILLGRCVTFSTSRFLFLPPDGLEAFLDTYTL